MCLGLQLTVELEEIGDSFAKVVVSGLDLLCERLLVMSI